MNEPSPEAPTPDDVRRRLLLVEILNIMYNDNIQQINNFTEHIANLNRSNTSIRNLIVELLYSGSVTRTQPQLPIQPSTRSNLFGNGNHYHQDIVNMMPTIPGISSHLRDNRNSNRSDIEYVLFGDLSSLFGSGRNRNYSVNNMSSMPRTNSTSGGGSAFAQLLQQFMQPVEVYPTQSQIETATRTVRYCDIVSPRNTSCPISLEPFTDNSMVMVIRHCGHVFDTEALNTWFRSHCACPICRYDIRDYNATVSSDLSTSSSASVISSTTDASGNTQSRANQTQSRERAIRNQNHSLISQLYDWTRERTP